MAVNGDPILVFMVNFLVTTEYGEQILVET